MNLDRSHELKEKHNSEVVLSPSPLLEHCSTGILWSASQINRKVSIVMDRYQCTKLSDQIQLTMLYDQNIWSLRWGISYGKYPLFDWLSKCTNNLLSSVSLSWRGCNQIPWSLHECTQSLMPLRALQPVWLINHGTRTCLGVDGSDVWSGTIHSCHHVQIHW